MISTIIKTIGVSIFLLGAVFWAFMALITGPIGAFFALICVVLAIICAR